MALVVALCGRNIYENIELTIMNCLYGLKYREYRGNWKGRNNGEYSCQSEWQQAE
jgi:hypothetical protein